ncbi:MAG: FUSC family protein [Pseudomonadota bacterium]
MTASTAGEADNRSAQSVAQIATEQRLAKARYATKTALSLALAYLIPMALGWPQPQTAAITVMLIAATGTAAESLHKGVLRIAGTVAGAIIGLTLIALFPQDRMIYLIFVSVTVSCIIYLYSAYQGDNTLFMLTAVVTLMVFNGGDAEGAFQYGIDRAFMTVVGVIIYSVVASLLWPVHVADNTRALAKQLCVKLTNALDTLTAADPKSDTSTHEQLASLLADCDSFRQHFLQVRASADGVVDYQPEWRCICACIEELESRLVLALQQESDLDFEQYITNYRDIIEQLRYTFTDVIGAWDGRSPAYGPSSVTPLLNNEKLQSGGHLTTATVVARADLLATLDRSLRDLLAAVSSLTMDVRGVPRDRLPSLTPAFIWLDLEHLKTALRAFVTFWVAALLWIHLNPPGGFMFVTMCMILVPLVSYTAASPKLLFVLFTIGFAFALPSYVFLLPQMTHWLQLGAFLFCYAFIGLFLLPGPIALFFLLGLFTLGIQNDMQYSFNVILLVMLMFYLVCAVLALTMQIPFSSRPQTVFLSVRRRFFHHCQRLLELEKEAGPVQRLRRDLLSQDVPLLLEKLTLWGNRLSTEAYPDCTPDRLQALTRSCEVLYGNLQALQMSRDRFVDNPLIRRAMKGRASSVHTALCQALANGAGADTFARTQKNLATVEERLDRFLEHAGPDQFSRDHLAQFYVFLHLQAAILRSLNACHRAQVDLGLQSLRETRF